MTNRNILFTIFIIYFLISLNISQSSKRNKRYIYFPYGGIHKVITAISIPIMIPKRYHGSLAMAINLQFQYPQISNLTQVAGDLPLIIKRNKRNIDKSYSERTLVYMALEKMMDRYEINGRACLLRSICDNAMYSLHHHANGLYGQLIHILLTPDYKSTNGDINLATEYVDAKKAGEYGMNCLSLYPNCQLGHGILDIISNLEEN